MAPREPAAHSDARPAGNGPGRKSLGGDIASLLRDPQVIALVAYVGTVSREIGYKQAEEDMARLWREAHRKVANVLRRPTHAELHRRRYGS